MTLKPDVDPKAGTIDAPIELGGKPEFLVSDGAGKVYINLVDKSEVAGEGSSGKFEIVQTVTTPVGARTMDIDAGTHEVFLATAEFEEQKPGATGRPQAKPGTFMIVVVGRH